MGPSIPNRATPTAPNASDPAIAAARSAALSAATNTYGRPQTILTSGMGAASGGQVLKKQLLGG